MANAKTARTPSKSDFIRAQPATLSAAEVVEKGKAQGVKFDAFLVYKVRSRASAKAKASRAPKAPSLKPPTKRLASKPKAPKVEARKAPAVRKGAGIWRPIATASSAEELLKALAAELGLGRAIEILDADRAAVLVAMRV